MLTTENFLPSEEKYLSVKYVLYNSWELETEMFLPLCSNISIHFLLLFKINWFQTLFLSKWFGNYESLKVQSHEMNRSQIFSMFSANFSVLFHNTFRLFNTKDSALLKLIFYIYQIWKKPIVKISECKYITIKYYFF